MVSFGSQGVFYLASESNIPPPDLQLIGLDGHIVHVNKLFFCSLSSYRDSLTTNFVDDGDSLLSISVPLTIEELEVIVKFVTYGVLPLVVTESISNALDLVGISLSEKNLVETLKDPNKTEPAAPVKLERLETLFEEDDDIESLSSFESEDSDHSGKVSDEKSANEEQPLNGHANHPKRKTRRKPREELPVVISGVDLTEALKKKSGRCPLCQKNSQRLKRHIQDVHAPSKENCEDCGRTFKSKRSLTRHIRRAHQNPDDTLCHECGAQLSCPAALYHHWRLYHSDPNSSKEVLFRAKRKRRTENYGDGKNTKVVCHLCAREFHGYGAQYRLEAHVLGIHTDDKDKPFHCSVCNKGFAEKTKLKHHMLIHDDVRAHKCSVCDKTFVEKCNMIRHEHAMHGIKPVKKNKKRTAESAVSVDS